MADEDFDPTGALNTVRRLTSTMQDRGVNERGAWELMDTFADLDQHLHAGGALPDQWRAKRGRPRAARNSGEVLEGVEHGLRSSYNKGCTCDLCRKANREYAAQRIANLKKNGSES